MNRPRYHNAQSRVMLEEMDRAFQEAMDDPEVRVVVLSGNGPSFSSGHDLGTPDEMADRDERGFPMDRVSLFYRRRSLYLELTQRWRDLPKPTIAMVHGYCTVGGWLIVSSMDVIFAAEDALFHPGQHLQWFSVPWDLGHRNAKAVLFEGRMLSAAQAHEVGFVYQVVPAADLEKETLAYAGRVAETDGFILQMTKFSINNAQDIMGFTAANRAAFHTQVAMSNLSPEMVRRNTEGRGKQLPFIGKALQERREGAADT
jgi:enoyl-CoA hydratase